SRWPSAWASRSRGCSERCCRSCELRTGGAKVRLSPLEIEHMEFPRGASGYQRKHVRDFLERVGEEVADLLREMQGLQSELDSAKQQVSDLQAKEAELQRAVIAAERIANEIKENAKREAK